MAETHNRVMESTTWNTTDSWPVPVECLLNGMAPTDPHLMFGGHMIQHQFRQRFQSPLQQLNGPPHLVSINPNVSLPTHSIIENSVTVDNNGQVEVNGETGQDGLSQNMPISTDDESEDSSDGDDLPQPGPQMSHSHGLTDNSLVQVQCVDQVSVVQDNLVHSQLPMNVDPHCHHPKLTNNVIAHNHHLHDPPINPLFFQQQDQFEPPPVVVEDGVDDSGSDPNTGFSVYGKLYYEREGRVVLHLKQWLDSPGDQNGSNMPFDPSDPLHGKNLIQGCALCRLSGPNQDSYRSQKQGHRHTFRGVLFTFEECTIVELYPEQTHSVSAHNGRKGNDNQSKLLHQQQSNGQRLNIPAYLPPPLDEQIQHQHQHLDMNPLQSSSHSEHKTTTDQSWWDHFPSGSDLKDNEESSELSDDEDGDGSNSIPEQREIVTVDITTHNPCFPEESNYQPVSAGSPYIQQESECDPDHGDSLTRHSPPMESLILIEHHDHDHEQQGTVGQDENLTTPTNQQDQEDLSFNLEESEPEDIAPIQPASPPPPQQPLAEPKYRGKYKCPCCAKSLPFKKTLKVHLDSEHVTNPFRCDKCQRQFTDEKAVTKHVCGSGTTSGHKSKPRKNGVIKSDHGQVDWTLNSSQMNQPRNNIKDSSKRDGSTTQNLKVVSPRKDKKRRHPMKKPLVHTCPGKKASKPFPCNLCSKSFSVQRRLDNHRLSHVNDKSSQCEKCGKRFARKDKLMRHMYVHSEEKMFSCDICFKRFSRRDKLADHLKSHGGPDEIHHCHLCKKEFLRPDILKQHVKLHGMRHKHQCPECLRFVTGQERLAQHMARHEEAKAQGQPLLCPLCTKNFIQRQSLKAHIKKFHPTAHVRLLSDLDFPMDPLDLEGDLEDCEVHDVKNEAHSEGSGHGEKFVCDVCSKQFTKRAPLLRHLSKHRESQSVTTPPKSAGEVTKKVKKTKKPNGALIIKRSSSPNPVPVDLLRSTNPSPVMIHRTVLPELSFTSAASQIVSPSSSPRPQPTDEDLDVDLTSTQTPAGLGPDNGYQLSQSAPATHIPLTLATMSLNSNSVSSQNGILMGSHSLQHAHALLQHAHPLAQGLPPIAHHPQGQIQTHISHVSMAHHMTQAQTMCAAPYVNVIYPHYYQ